MTHTLTAEFVKANRVAFRPKTPEEAVAVQQWLFRHGIAWKGGKMEIGYISECIAKGMVVAEGRLLHSPSDTPAFNANLRDLQGIKPDDFLTAEQRLDRRLTALETSVAGLHTKLDRVLQALQPQVLGKPALPRKDGSAGP